MVSGTLFFIRVVGGEETITPKNKAAYTATLVACGWAGVVLEKVTRASGQEPYAHKAQKRQKSNSPQKR